MHIQDAIDDPQGETTIKGWVYRERGSNKIRFLVVRDTDNVIQCVVKKDSVSADVWSAAENAKMEAAVVVSGTLTADERAPTGVELQVSDLEVVGGSDDFPITEDYSIEHLANNRHLWLRSRRMNAILKIRHTVFQAFREYFNSHGFREYHSPIFQATQAEGGSSLFAVEYFDDELYLAQTWQLYAEAGVQSVEKIYTVAPSFRAEKSKTSRHLTEYWHGEMEMAWCSFDDIIAHGEGVVKACVTAVLDECAGELAELDRDPDALRPTADEGFVRMTYDEALEILEDEHGMEVEWGEDLRTRAEDALTQGYDAPVIVTHYPTRIKAFYMKRAADNEDVVQGMDFIAPEGYGEIIGGSQREEDVDVLVERLKEDGEDPSEYRYYLDTRRYGSVPHGGFGLGMERLISWVCGLDNIKDAIPFPRTPTRYTP